MSKLEGFTDIQEKMIEEIKDGQGQQQQQLWDHKRGSGTFELMPNIISGIKSKLSLTSSHHELQMMMDPNLSTDAKLMRMDALYDEKLTKIQRLIDAKMDKRDFAYFEGLFNYEVKKFNGFI